MMKRRYFPHLIAVAITALFLESHGQAQTAQLQYEQAFLVTGDYVVGGVDLREDLHPIVGGLFSEAQIPISGVPQDADVVAAYLMWETTTLGGEAWRTDAAGVQFRGFDIDIESPMVARGTSVPGDGASCFGSGSVLMHMFMADVLRFLPLREDKDGNPTAKRVVNSADLAAHGLDPHEVKLPVRNGNNIPESSGASLVIIYNNPAPTTPLKKIVIYRGNNRKLSLNGPLEQTIQGFYGSAKANKAAKVTFLLASGQPNANLKVSFTAGQDLARVETPISTSSLFTPGDASQRWWAMNATFDVSSLMTPPPTPGNYGDYSDYGNFGETVSTKIYHQPTNGSYDCVALGAVVFSTNVQDEDVDGLPDALEDTTPALFDPPRAGHKVTNPPQNQLPDFKAMGAGRLMPDIFVEVNALWAPGGTSYGSLEAPYGSKAIATCAAGAPTVCTTEAKHELPIGTSQALVQNSSNGDLNKPLPTDPWEVIRIDDTSFSIPVASSGGTGGTLYVATKTDTVGHHHMPTPYELGKIGNAFAERGIRIHFDVGDIAAYRDLDGGDLEDIVHTDWVDDYDAPTFPDDEDRYLVPSGLARGGELIEEKACDPDDPGCHFPHYAGTVGWPAGLQYIRDSPVDNDGEEFDAATSEDAWIGMLSQGRRRFDPVRMDFFRYLLHAHARAKPRSQPCLVDGNPAPYDLMDGTACTTPNPNFNPLRYHVPSTTSGVANLPGRNALVTMGLWDEFVGRPFNRLGTTFHEIGHLLGLWHGGAPTTWGNKVQNTSTFVQPNCKPNHLSSMSYNFQIQGLWDDNDDVYVDFSSLQQNPQSDQTLSDHVLPNPLGGFRAYRPAWFAPVGSALVNEQGASAAKTYCNGAPFTSLVEMARVQAEFASDYIDWNGDQNLGGASFGDANFDGVISTTLLAGHDDWENIRLNQIGATPFGILPGSVEGVFGATWAGVFGATWEGLFGQTWEGVFGATWEGVFGATWEGVFGATWEGVFGATWEGVFGATWEGVFGATWEGVFGATWEGIFAGTAEGQEEITLEITRGLGKGRPYKGKLCVAGRDDYFSPFDPATEQQIPCGTGDEPPSDVLFTFLPPLDVSVTSYEIQRRATDAADTGTPDDSYETIGTIPANQLIFRDPDDLADGVFYQYRARGPAADDGENTGWSRAVEIMDSLGIPRLGIEARNIAPVAADDAVDGAGNPLTVATGSSINIAVLANDTDPDSLASAIYVKQPFTQAPAHGTAVINTNQTVTYTPDPTYPGPYPFTETFKYVADNGPWSGDTNGQGVTRMSAASNEATVTVTVTTVTNAAPVCSVTLTRTVFTRSSTTLAHNCTDANGDLLTVFAVSPVKGGGTVTLTTPLTGSFTYNAPANATTANFTFSVRDGKGGVATGNAQITVTRQ